MIAAKVTEDAMRPKVSMNGIGMDFLTFCHYLGCWKIFLLTNQWLTDVSLFKNPNNYHEIRAGNPVVEKGWRGPSNETIARSSICLIPFPRQGQRR
jgi:hypothetical protein